MLVDSVKNKHSLIIAEVKYSKVKSQKFKKKHSIELLQKVGGCLCQVVLTNQ